MEYIARFVRICGDTAAVAADMKSYALIVAAVQMMYFGESSAKAVQASVGSGDVCKYISDIRYNKST